MKGVLDTQVGYTGGKSPNPTYKRILDHTEAIRIVFDPEQVSYRELLGLFFNWHRAYPGARTQYRSAVWFHSQDQLNTIQSVRGESGGAHTAIEPSGDFYRAEEYHQKWSEKSERRTHS